MGGVLDQPGRAALRRALAGRVDEAAALERVPVADHGVGETVRGALGEALPGQLDRLRSTRATLLRLFPGSALAPDGEVTSLDLGRQGTAALSKVGWTRWSDLVDRPVRSILSLPGVGGQAASRLLESCFARSLATVVDTWASDPAAGDLGVVLRHERGEAGQPVLEALLERWSGDGPPAAGEAAGRLLEAAAPWALDAGGALSTLLTAAGDERSRMVFAALCLPRGSRPAAGELASGLGVSGARVLQLRDRAEARVRDALGTAPFATRWLVASLVRRLGPVAAEERALRTLGRLGVGIPRSDPRVADLALFLAGPYHEVAGRPGWLATDPRSLVATTTAGLQADGGVRPLADLAGELAAVGVRPDELEAWLASSGAAVTHELAVQATGPLADVVERILDAHGSARSADDLAADLARAGRAVDPGTLARLGGHRRFRMVDGALSLACWGAGGPAIPSGPAPPVRPAGSDRAGRREQTAPAAQTAPAGERQWLAVPVDHDVLRGSEGPVPVTLVDDLGMARRTRRTFSSRFGPVALSYDAPDPARGSVRAVALATGAQAGDTLVLGFAKAGDVIVEVRRAAAGERAGEGDRVTAAGRRPGTTETATGGAS